jgi:hypothetical protein
MGDTNSVIIGIVNDEYSSLTFNLPFFILTARSFVRTNFAREVSQFARVAQWQRNRLVIGRLVGSTPLSGFDFESGPGGVPEWTIGADCKSAA